MQSGSSPRIYLCIKDSVLAATLTNQLQKAGYRVSGFTDEDGLESSALTELTHPPAAIVISPSLSDDSSAGIELLSKLRVKFPELPLVMCCKNDDLPSRLNALRAGATRYFSVPVDFALLIDSLIDLTTSQPEKAYRALIIDDDELSLQLYSHILKHVGMDVYTLADPARTLKMVDGFQPEVIVLDIRMPGVSGIEIAAVLRERESSRDVPILFLTSDSDVSIELDALRLGGDAFYVKPVQADRFKDAVVSRARRFRERRQARERLDKVLYERDREHKALNRHALVSVTDKHGNIIELNDLFCEVSGYFRQELMGENHRILKSGIHDNEFYLNIWRTILQGETWYGEKCNRRKDGSLYWIEATITPFMDSSGKPYQYIGISTDITQRKQDESKLKDAKRQAEKANQAKSEFLANMSHELRTPLNAIVGFSQLLDDAPGLQDMYKQDIAEIHKAGKHLLGLINDILELSKIESGHVAISTTQVQLKPVVSECVSMVTQLAIDNGLTFSCDDFDGDMKVLGDRTKIRQVLLNLLSNAIKYNRVAGDVRITITSPDSDNVRIAVKDTGKGISKAQFSNLFTPFSRLDAKFSDIEGTGIGLTITKEMVERMEGEIGVVSEQGQGSEFWFTLPKVKNHAAELSPETGTRPGQIAATELTHLSQVKIVCVDDNKINLAMLLQLLSRDQCYEVHGIRHALDAMDTMRRLKPDIAILDIHMPHLDGYELLHNIQTCPELAQMKVLALSAAALHEDRQKGLQAGFYKYLTKPLDYNVLKQAISDCLDSAPGNHD